MVRIVAQIRSPVKAGADIAQFTAPQIGDGDEVFHFETVRPIRFH